MRPSARLVRLPYQGEWTAAAVAAVLEALPWLAERRTAVTVPRLRQLVKDQAALLALMHWLAQGAVPYTVETFPGTLPGRAPLWVAGRRLFPQAVLLSHRAGIQALRQHPEQAQQRAWATVPEPRLRALGGAPEDLFVFGLVLGLVAQHPQHTPRLLAKALPLRLIFPLPLARRRWPGEAWLSLKYEGPGTLSLVLYGRRAGKAVRYPVDLRAGERQRLEQPWGALYALVTEQVPAGRVGVGSTLWAQPLVVPAQAWGNLWLYGMEVWWLGYLSRRAFLQQARLLPPGASRGWGLRLPQRAYAVPVESLRPMADLSARLKTPGA